MGEELSSDIGKIINTPNPRTAALGYSAILYNVDKNEEVNISEDDYFDPENIIVDD